MDQDYSLGKEFKIWILVPGGKARGYTVCSPHMTAQVSYWSNSPSYLAKRTARDHSLEDLTEPHLQAITDKDVRLPHVELKPRSMAVLQNTQVVIILPEERCFRRALAKARFTLSKVARIESPFRRSSVRLNNGLEDRDAYVLWALIKGSRQLLILRVRYRTLVQIQSLPKEAMNAVREWNMRAIAILDMNDCDALAATRVSNQDSIDSSSCAGQFRHSPVDLGTGSPRAPVELMAHEGFVWT
ncbi:hypothetical protein BGZ50_004101 [Haplosporangium sp. Z 11]|nr:hypothetical protein BGZ50_004101 [Haplosporangium sp. Z 11]